MKYLKYGHLLPIFVLLTAPVMAASTIDVTTTPLVTLQTSDSLLCYIADAGSCDHRSTYPAEIQMILGAMPLGGPTANLPGRSGVYIPGVLFNGSLESQNDSSSIPLVDSDAASVGLPAGIMLLTPGWRWGGSYSGSIDLLSATVDLTPAQSAALFSSGEAIIELKDVTGTMTFGYPLVPIANDLQASLISANGHQSEGARVLKVECVSNNIPEPGTMGMLIIGLTVLSRRLTRFSTACRTR